MKFAFLSNSNLHLEVINISFKNPETINKPKADLVKRKQPRPKTAKTKSVPRYLQSIHNEKPVDGEFQLKNFFYRDIALIRFLKDENAQWVNEKQFTNLFLQRNNDPYWKNVDYVQTNVKSKFGIGIPIVIKFYADLQNRSEDNNRLIYDYQKYTADLDNQNQRKGQ